MSLWRRIYRERRGIVLPLIVLAVLVVGIFVGGVLPLRAHVSGLEATAVDAENDLKIARADDLKANREQQLKQQADVDLQKFYRDILPRDFNAASELTSYFLDKSARESGLRYESGTFRPERSDSTKKSRLTKMTGDVTLKGEYNAVRRFLYRLETAEEFVIVEDVQLNQPGGPDSGNTLELNLTVTTSFLAAPAGGPSR
jgi:hypothetical protein